MPVGILLHIQSSHIAESITQYYSFTLHGVSFKTCFFIDLVLATYVPADKSFVTL